MAKTCTTTWANAITTIISSSLVKFHGTVGTKFEIDNVGHRIFFIGSDDKIYQVANTNCPGTSWFEAVLNTNAPLSYGQNAAYGDGSHLFYVGPNNDLHNLYWDGSSWLYDPLNTCRVSKASYG